MGTKDKLVELSFVALVICLPIFVWSGIANQQGTIVFGSGLMAIILGVIYLVVYGSVLSGYLVYWLLRATIKCALIIVRDIK